MMRRVWEWMLRWLTCVYSSSRGTAVSGVGHSLAYSCMYAISGGPRKGKRHNRSSVHRRLCPFSSIRTEPQCLSSSRSTAHLFTHHFCFCTGSTRVHHSIYVLCVSWACSPVGSCAVGRGGSRARAPWLRAARPSHTHSHAWPRDAADWAHKDRMGVSTGEGEKSASH